MISELFRLKKANQPKGGDAKFGLNPAMILDMAKGLPKRC